MIAFLIAIVAGFLTPRLEKPVAQPLAGILRAIFEVDEREEPVLAFIVALLIASLIAAILDSDAVLGVAVGVVLGYFGARIVNVTKTILENRQK